MVSGVLIPLTLNPVPLIATWDTVTLVPPVLLIVSETDCCVPTVTLPKASLEGLLANCPAAIPAPVSERVEVASDALLAIVTVAANDPTASGVNARLRMAL